MKLKEIRVKSYSASSINSSGQIRISKSITKKLDIANRRYNVLIDEDETPHKHIYFIRSEKLGIKATSVNDACILNVKKVLTDYKIPFPITIIVDEFEHDNKKGFKIEIIDYANK